MAVILNGVTFNTTGSSVVGCVFGVVNVRLPDTPLVTPVKFGVRVTVAGVVPD